MKYRKKPVEIDAFQWQGTFNNSLEIEKYFGQNFTVLRDSTKWVIGTLEGPHEVSIGDWIVKGIKGEFYPVKNEIFEMTYEKVEEDAK